MRPEVRRRYRSTLFLAAAIAAGLGVGEAAAQPLERGRAAEARGDLRAAQIEYRNAVRNQPDNGAVRLALGQVSLAIGDIETALREARAALESGHDLVGATSLLLRAYLAREQFRELLREFSLPDNPTNPAVAAQIAAARALAELALGQRDAARAMVQVAMRLAPEAVEPRMAAVTLALVEGDRGSAKAELDRVLAIHPNATGPLLRMAALQAENGETGPAIATLDRLVAAAPGHVQGRILRAELLTRAGEDARAREDVDAVLRVLPGNVLGHYMQALLHTRAQRWREADEVLQRLSRALPSLPDGLLLQATVKRALNERAQAEDAAQRHTARRPEDPRGAKLLAGLQMESSRPDAAAATLSRLAQAGGADAEAFDLLGRAHAAANRPREAMQAFRQATERAPEDAGIRARLGAARLALGDTAGTEQDAIEALRIAPEQPGARELMAIASLLRGDMTAAQTAWERLTPEQRRGEVAGTLEGLLHLARFDLTAARNAFETTLRNHPSSVRARLGLARVATAQGDPAEAERQLAEVLRRDPRNTEALGRIAATIAGSGPRAAAAREILQNVQAAAPTVPQLALALSTALRVTGDTAAALAVLNTPALREPGQGPGLPLTRSQLEAARGQWAEAETEAQAALVEDATSVAARRQLVTLQLRAGNPAAAERTVQEGLRAQPDNAALQQTLLGVVRQARGLDAALQTADRLAETAASRPASLFLRGELLLAAGRPAEAGRAFAAARERVPLSGLVQREAQAWRAAGQTEQAVAALNAWLAREPEDAAALNLMAQFDLAAGQTENAERRLGVVVERTPDNAVALNNLAWILAERGGAENLARARRLAERGYFLLPNAETADTFGWVLAKTGDVARAVVLLRQAVEAPRPQGQELDRDKVFRLAHVLRAGGQREEALRALEPALAAPGAFQQRPQAERLMAELRAER
ncbi:XrtA/PEP-CTERM system TPR-repeat protein PrsT [Belnapia moabensis]|uniref:XrtA/PEP-CTERM system TPR-repeat protein PrsT n=1 Tax=Belnapia moabensis TaxID=365533 RepID=UPI0005B88E7B|nr:XrtA/PEP-CTERM system TPR-repeat protein PrsT [Belnapia moabensis]